MGGAVLLLVSGAGWWWVVGGGGRAGVCMAACVGGLGGGAKWRDGECKKTAVHLERLESYHVRYSLAG